MEVVNALGRRKSAIARVFVSEGTGKITINKRDLAVYFPSSILQYVVKQPLNKLGVAEKYDIKVNLCGGGFTGQSQALRLAIARALVKRPKLILADEPTAALDYATGIEVLTLIEKVVAGGTSVVMVTHNEEITKMADRVIRMRGGYIDEVLVNRHPVKAADLVW